MEAPLLHIALLKNIGIPGIIDAEARKFDHELLKIAALNKIALLYSSISSANDNYNDLLKRHQLLLRTIENVCSAFNKHGIQYCVFKTIKPFPTTPSDVDILISNDDFKRAESVLMGSGYKRTTYDAYSSTLEKEMIVDLQLQPSVSNVPYLPRTLLMKNTIVKKINGFDVCTLNPEAELIVIAAHSIYKEQMFTMNDYYAITMLAEQADPMFLFDLAKSANVNEAVRMVVGLCSQITRSVFNSDLQITNLTDIFGPRPTNWPIQTLPMKFPFSLILKLLLSRASRDKEMRAKVLPAIVRLASPRQLAKLFAHVMRNTY